MRHNDFLMSGHFVKWTRKEAESSAQTADFQKLYQKLRNIGNLWPKSWETLITFDPNVE